MDAAAQLLNLIHPTAEATTLAAMRDDMTLAVSITQMLEPDYYSNPRHQVVFQAIRNLLQGIEPIDAAAITAECISIQAESKQPVNITLDFVTSLDGDRQRAIPYANTVRRMAWLRGAGDFAFWLVQELQSNPDPDELFVAAQERWQQLQPARSNSGFVYGWDTVDMQATAIAERIQEAEDGKSTMFDWPWAAWNRIIRPLRAGMVGILAAPDGMGKTTYLEMVAEHWAIRGFQVVYVHLEDDLSYKLDRRTARHALVSMNHIEDGTLDSAERKSIRDADTRIGKWASGLHYYHAAGKSMTEILRELETRISEGVCQAVVFDYLDKVTPTQGQGKLFGSNTWERQAHDMELLKSFAENHAMPVFTATQGNKAMQSGGTQTRQNIQGSGQKSQKAQLVLILTRDIVGDSGLTDKDGKQIAGPGEYSPIVNLRVDKQNRGQTGSLQQFLVGRFFTVRDIERSA